MTTGPVPKHADRVWFAGECRALLKLGLPVIAAQLAQVAMNFVDTTMAGNYSAPALAAVAVGGSLWMTATFFVTGLLMAVTALVSHSFGGGRVAEVGSTVRQALWLSQGLAWIAFFTIRSTAPVLDWMDIEPDLIPVALGYLDAISWGLPAMCAFVVLRYYSEGVSATRPVMVISLMGLGLNIFGNYVLMYGRFGLPALGAVGCGWATAIVLWAMCAAMAARVYFGASYRRFGVFARFDWPDAKGILGIVRLGLPIGISVFLEVSLFATVALLMGSLGTSAVAAHQIAINVASITFMVPLGLSMAITVRVGQAMGRGAPADARRSGVAGVCLALGFMASSSVVLVTLPGLIVGIYTHDAGVVAIATDLLLMAALFQLSDGAQVAGAGALRGLKDTTVPMLITLVAYWGMGLPLGYVLGVGRAQSPQAMWVGLIVGLTVAALCLNGRFLYITRQRGARA